MASKGASALTGAGVGAAAGTAIMPGVGTLVGAGVGALGGYLLGDDPADPNATGYRPNRENFRYGLGPQGGYADQQAQHYNERQFGLDAQRDNAQLRRGPTQAMPAPIVQAQSGGQAYLQGADAQARQQQLAALGGIQSQTAALNQYAQAPQGPSAAQAQLQAGTDMAARQQYGFARSQPGGGGSALRAAAFNAAGISGNAANTAAMLTAQETQAYRNQQLQALGAAQQGAGMSAGYAGQLRGADQGFAQVQAGQANYDANATNQFNQGQQQMQFNVGQNNLNAGLQTQNQNDAYTLGLTGASQAYDQLRNGVAGAATGQGNAFEAATAQGAGLGVQNKSVDNAQSNAETGMTLGALSSGIGAYAQSQQAGGGAPGTQAQLAGSGAPQRTGPTSDVRAKTNIRQADVLAALTGATAGGAAAAQSNMPATEYPTMPANTRFHGSHADFAPDLRPAQGYEYSYKDPQADGAGRYVGPMAQDLEHLPGVVEQGADGKKAINAPRLTLANTAAVSELQRKQDELERQQRLQALGAATGGGFVRPDLQQPDYAAYGAPGYHY